MEEGFLKLFQAKMDCAKLPVEGHIRQGEWLTAAQGGSSGFDVIG